MPCDGIWLSASSPSRLKKPLSAGKKRAWRKYFYSAVPIRTTATTTYGERLAMRSEARRALGRSILLVKETASRYVFPPP
jgi:hypothetical protein